MQRPFLPLLCALRENKTVRSIGAKVDNIYKVEAGLLHMVSLLCALRENKTVRSIGTKVDNIYTVEAGLLHMVSEPAW